ncbi:MCE family protein [Microvirga sp. STR05]|uniref:MCE family protein n=1 Tax=Hymenobacter duratus TaxID=2771356 RepID=A0ABR8JKH2_9BACT|nr:MCE family protein [Hymenobacter duratus]MBD2715885.1 MCE family protein [Hymenobacter duratus]MBR7950797.1 MCE family protein [Microvirga sp. STR05]
MLRRFLLFSGLLAGLNACSSGTVCYLKSTEADGLSTDSPVLMNGVKVGAVERFSIEPDSLILVRLQLAKDVVLPNDSRFQLERSLLGTGSIVVVAGRSPQPLRQNDTLLLAVPTSADSNRLPAAGLLQALFGNKQDSLLIELRRLNRNLEKANKD